MHCHVPEMERCLLISAGGPVAGLTRNLSPTLRGFWGGGANQLAQYQRLLNAEVINTPVS